MTVIKPGDQVPYTVGTHALRDSVTHCGLVLWQQELQLEICFKDEIKTFPFILTIA